jgi:hypothetical protein
VFAKNAPGNEAFTIPLNIIDANDTSIATLFKCHTLAPFVRAADFWNGPHIIQTTLVDAAFTNLSGGQVVVGNGMQGQQTSVTPGLQSISTIVVPVSVGGMASVSVC